jgi:hypothetical protein
MSDKLITVEGDLKDNLLANTNNLERCIELLIEWGANPDDAQTYVSVTFGNEQRWSADRTLISLHGERWLKEEEAMDRVEETCLKHLFGQPNQGESPKNEQPKTNRKSLD